MTEPRTVTLPTTDHGPVTLPEPSWCHGHAHHDPHSVRADLTHTSPQHPLTFHGRQLGYAVIAHAPYGELGHREIRAAVTISIEPDPDGLTPAGLYDLAAALDTSADQLRDVGDQLHAILGETGGAA
ncbi:hypothetical protein ABZ092_30465 [Streptomyces bobili]|uniref:DUF6907 domain-containing protein n=1 Tax=Streptomyces bobili TaxID=67280 RepID=UPI0033A106EC